MTQFNIPKKPKIELKEKKPDARRFSVIPLRALHDKGLTRGDYVNLIALCSYCSPNGFTFVSHATIAKLRGVKGPGVSRTLKKLENMGYFEQVRKGYPLMRGSLKRVIYDESLDLSTQESNSGVSIDSLINREEEAMKRAASNQARQDTNALKVKHTCISFEDALLVVAEHLKSDADLLKLEHLITSGSSEAEVVAAFS